MKRALSAGILSLIACFIVTPGVADAINVNVEPFPSSRNPFALGANLLFETAFGLPSKALRLIPVANDRHFWIADSQDRPATDIPLEPGTQTKEFAELGEELKKANIQPGMDLSILAQLNTDAAVLWKKLVDCSGGNAGEARMHYQRGDFSCPEKSALLRDIKQLHARFEQFTVSSDFEDLDLNDDSRVTSNKQRLPHIHPLLAQIAFDGLIREPIFYAVDRKPLGVSKGVTLSEALRIRNRMLFYVFYFPLNDCTELGLWPQLTSFVMRDLEHASSADYFLEYQFSFDGQEPKATFLDHMRATVTFAYTADKLCDSSYDIVKLVMEDGHVTIGYGTDIEKLFRGIARRYY